MCCYVLTLIYTIVWSFHSTSSDRICICKRYLISRQQRQAIRFIYCELFGKNWQCYNRRKHCMSMGELCCAVCNIVLYRAVLMTTRPHYIYVRPLIFNHARIKHAFPGYWFVMTRNNHCYGHQNPRLCNRSCYPGGHYMDYYTDAPSLSQVIASHWKVRHQ